VRNGGEGTAVLFLDLDGFKAINDHRGHSVGDDVLQLVADRLRTATRGADDVGRLGGDEFLVVCHDVTEEGALKVADRIAQLVGRRANDVQLDAPLRVSVGVAWSAAGSVDAATLVGRADAAMYASKRAGIGEPHLWSAPA
jgi:diguanylate cyclase (GGDEF)-like protein